MFNQQTTYFSPYVIWPQNMSQQLEPLPDQVIFSGAGQKPAVLDVWIMIQYQWYQIPYGKFPEFSRVFF